MKISGIIRTLHENPQQIAESVSADNMTGIETGFEGEYVVTRITSTRIRTVIASLDDYLTNIIVAEGVRDAGGSLTNDPEDEEMELDL